jgi:hypothetical protein
MSVCMNDAHTSMCMCVCVFIEFCITVTKIPDRGARDMALGVLPDNLGLCSQASSQLPLRD